MTAGEPGNGHVPEDEIRAELKRILASDEFRSSRRCQEFLEYVVETTLGGKGDTLKERTIATDVLGKPASYDPSEDASVRVRAGEVRRRLELCYRHPKAESTVVIELPPGRYTPEFRYRQKDEASATTAGSRAGLARGSWRGRLAVAAALTALGLAGITWLRSRSATSALDRFWSPVFESDTPVSLCASLVPVYLRIEEPVPDKPCGDFVLVPNEFVAAGDLEAVSQLSEMLTRTRRPYRMRIGREVSFRELLTGPAILVGYSYTEMQEISKSLRFCIDRPSVDRAFGIMDKGSTTPWTLKANANDPNLTEDYALVSRFFDAKTHNMVVEIAGISHYGTEAAARFVTNPTSLAEAFRGAPPGWEKKNLQIVFHVQVIQGAPTVAAVLATHYW